jgi:hypothetical protein
MILAGIKQGRNAEISGKFLKKIHLDQRGI